ncbi:MAG TPA: ABC transporter permease [Candidatus Competibacteraceae bacterium]|nr:ABC transporter permease [Candidatus Competibacteraceae bacterium]
MRTPSRRRIYAVFKARNREFLRDRSSLAWNILFPVLIVIAFAVIFRGEGAVEQYKVGLYPLAAERQPATPFLATRGLDAIPQDDLNAALRKVEHHQLDLLLDLEGRRYWVNDSSPKGYLLERVLWGTAGHGFAKQTVSGRAVRYVDWVVPGVLATNMMFSCLFGVGYVIVRYRKNGMLRRLKATPLSAFEFLVAQVASRLWLILGITVLVFLGTNAFVHFTLHGRYLDLLLVFTLGAISLISLGLVIAARTASEELAGGLLNLASWPMMLLSGVWFSLEGTHPWVQKLAQLLPLTHVVEAARAVMLDGAGLAEIALRLVVLALMALLFLLLGALGFRWE